jgi:hypothetical protein
MPLIAQQEKEVQARLREAATALEAIPSDSLRDIQAKENAFRQHESTPEYQSKRDLANAWCAAFVIRKYFPEKPGYPGVPADEPFGLTQRELNALAMGRPLAPELGQEVERIAAQYQFLHWHLAYPEVFARGGFDVMLGNPPWEKLTISEEEWFAARNPQIAETKGKARRDAFVEALRSSGPLLWTQWTRARRTAEASALLMGRDSGRYPLTGTGELNTYHLFAELSGQIVASCGRVGIIVKTGIGAANNCLPFIKRITDARQLVSLFDFVNTNGLFPAVQTVERFSLLVFTGTRGTAEPVQFATLCEDPGDLSIPGRRYTLSPEDISLMSPYNGAIPLLKGDRDAAIMRRIYRSFPLLGDSDSTDLWNLWNVSYVRIFDMATDSGQFKRREELEALGLHMDALRRFVCEDDEYWPLYEGKYIYLMDHRYGTFENVPSAKRYGRKASAPTPSPEQLADPTYEIVPRYWFPKSLWEERRAQKGLRSDYQFQFRDVAGVYPDLRTAIGAICPAGPAGHKAPVLMPASVGDRRRDAERHLLLCALFCSIPFDYVVRNKLFSKSLTFNTLGQIPIPPPALIGSAGSREALLGRMMVDIALELSFTSWSLASLGAALGVSRPFVWRAERRFALLRAVDAIAAHLCGLTREEFEYVLSTFETLARSEQSQWGEYQTAKTCLVMYDQVMEGLDPLTSLPYARSTGVKGGRQ